MRSEPVSGSDRVLIRRARGGSFFAALIYPATAFPVLTSFSACYVQINIQINAQILIISNLLTTKFPSLSYAFRWLEVGKERQAPAFPDLNVLF